MHRIRSCLFGLLASTLLAGQLGAQATGTISGRIINAGTQEPLARVRVTVADRTAQSGLDGRYSMSGVAAGTYTLRATFLGYREVVDTVTVTGGGTTTLDLALQPVAVELSDLVVVGYGEQKKGDVTGVVTEVTADQFNTGRVVSAEGLIRGKVAGVQVSESNGGEPGGGISVRIRGSTSINNSNEPLYVVDGVPLPVGGGLSAGRNPINFLNPNDIESMTVLKDASATAIYGSQGANGVVMITTRSGRGAQASPAGWSMTYRGSVSGSNIVGKPDVLTAAEFRQAVLDQQPAADTLLGTATTDWLGEVTRSAVGQEHSVVVSGGAEKTTLRASLGYLKQDGVVRASRSERISLNLAFNQLLFNDHLNLQANLTGARTKDRFTPGGVLGSAINMAPTQPILDTASQFDGYFEWDDPLATNNPVAMLNQISDEGVTYRSLGNLTGTYSAPFMPGLSATARMSFGVTNAERRYFAPSSTKNETENNGFGTVSRSNPSETNSGFDGFLTYDRNLGTEHTLTLTGGYGFSQRRQDSPFFQARQLSSDMLGPNGIPTAGFQETRLFVQESKLSSWFARANYSFRDRYLFTGSLRRDGSSRFGPGNQWGTFPSAAVAWRISEEGFLGDAFSDLKLRFSWGKNGNQAFGDYMQYKAYSFGEATAQVQFGNEFVNTIRPSASDPNIKWEETTSWNLGLEYGLWNNRLSGSFEIYNKKTKDLIFTVIVPAGVNLSNVLTTNVGSMKNRGIELTLNALLLEGRNNGFSWDANFNAAYNTNELVVIDPFAGGTEQILTGNTISGGVGTFIQVLTPGQPINSFFVLQHRRDGAGKPIYSDFDGDGDIDDFDLYIDQPTELDTLTGQLRPDSVINQDDRVPFKSPAPKWILGHTSQFRFKAFDLSFTMVGHIGNFVYNNVASSTGFYDQLRDSARPSNLHSSVLDYGFITPQYLSDAYVEDASFLRMENIELGYTFRGGMLNNMRIFGVVQNVFTLTGYTGIDPTATVTGIDNNIYPRARTFTGGLSVTF